MRKKLRTWAVIVAGMLTPLLMAGAPEPVAAATASPLTVKVVWVDELNTTLIGVHFGVSCAHGFGPGSVDGTVHVAQGSTVEDVSFSTGTVVCDGIKRLLRVKIASPTGTTWSNRRTYVQATLNVVEFDSGTKATDSVSGFFYAYPCETGSDDCSS
jgi:hypothetical protein